jgi:hypothetical protein
LIALSKPKEKYCFKNLFLYFSKASTKQWIEAHQDFFYAWNRVDLGNYVL